MRGTSRLLSASALAVLAPWPAAGPTLAFLKFLLGPANATFPGHLLLGILDPADELVAGKWGDVLPGIECRGVGNQRLAHVSWKLVHHPTGHSRATHGATVAVRASSLRPCALIVGSVVEKTVNDGWGSTLPRHTWKHAKPAIGERLRCAATLHRVVRPHRTGQDRTEQRRDRLPAILNVTRSGLLQQGPE